MHSNFNGICVPRHTYPIPEPILMQNTWKLSFFTLDDNIEIKSCPYNPILFFIEPGNAYLTVAHVITSWIIKLADDGHIESVVSGAL